MQLYEEPPEARGVISSKGKILTEREPIPSPGIDEAPLSIGDSSARERLWRLFTLQMGQQ